MIEKLLDDEQITQLEAVHQKYHELKCMSNSSNGGDPKCPGPSLNLISDDVVNSIKVMVEGNGGKSDLVKTDTTNAVENSKRASAMKALKNRAMSSDITISSHMRYLHPEESNESSHPQYVIPNETNTPTGNSRTQTSFRKQHNRKGSLQKKLSELTQKNNEMPYYVLKEDVKPCSNNQIESITDDVHTNEVVEMSNVPESFELNRQSDLLLSTPTSSKKPRKRCYPSKQNLPSPFPSESPQGKRSNFGRKSKENAQLRLMAMTNGDDVDLDFGVDKQTSSVDVINKAHKPKSLNGIPQKSSSGGNSSQVDSSLPCIPKENIASPIVTPLQEVVKSDPRSHDDIQQLTSTSTVFGGNSRRIENFPSLLQPLSPPCPPILQPTSSTFPLTMQPTSPQSTTGSCASIDSSCSAICSNSIINDTISTPSSPTVYSVPTVEERLKLPLTTGKLVAIAPIGKYVERPLIGRIVEVHEETIEIEWLMGSYSTKWTHWTVGRGANKYILTEPVSKERILASDFDLTESKKLPSKIRKSLRKMYLIIDGN